MAKINTLIANDFPPNISIWDEIPIYKNFKHEVNNDSDILLITAGDSWTWGASLDPDKRIDQIYGTRLCHKLQCDFINIGLLGGDNLSIIQAVDFVINNLSKQYKQIYVVITLTELGRETRSSFLWKKSDYVNLSGPDWPTFEEIIHATENNEKLNFALEELQTMAPLVYFELCNWIKLRTIKSFDEWLIALDKINLEQLSTVKNNVKHHNVTWVVGKNFVNWISANDNILANCIKLEHIWTDIISQQGNLEKYPSDCIAGVMRTGRDPIIDFCNAHQFDNSKQHLVNLFENSLLAHDWFDLSPFNDSRRDHSRHPFQEAHQWWADYIYSNIEKKL